MKTSKKYYGIVYLMLMMFVNALIFAPSANAQTSATNTFTDLPIVGTVGGVPFTGGTLDIQRFKSTSQGLVAVGKLTIPGQPVRNQTIQIPVTIQQAECEILDLSLGPLDLNLLGLVIHLDEVNLDITAQPGPLVGSLLCAIAGLLDGGFSLGLVADVLNVLVDVLNALGL